MPDNALYTCVDATGRKYKIAASTSDTVGFIKQKCSDKWKCAIEDVTEEVRLTDTDEGDEE